MTGLVFIYYSLRISIKKTIAGRGFPSVSIVYCV